MAKIPDDIVKAWNSKKGPIIFTTTGEDGAPNSIYATCVSIFGDNMILIADNYFDKTRKNIMNGCKGSVLFMDESEKAFQIKGFISYHTKGEIFNNMKSWNPKEHPGHAVAALAVERIYSGAEQIL